MNFSKEKKRRSTLTSKLKGRTGHQLAQLGEWLLVVGGVDS